MCGMSAGEVKALDPSNFDRLIFRAAFADFILKLRVAEDTYNDETRIKVNVTRCASFGTCLGPVAEP